MKEMAHWVDWIGSLTFLNLPEMPLDPQWIATVLPERRGR